MEQKLGIGCKFSVTTESNIFAMSFAFSILCDVIVDVDDGHSCPRGSRGPNSEPLPRPNKNSSGDEIANVNFYAVRPEGTRIR